MSTAQKQQQQQQAGNRSPAKDTSGTTTTTTTTTSILTTSSSSAGTKTPQHVTFVSSRNGAGGGGNTSRSSPVSPSRLTRLQEKEEMQNLNDRLVVYIDTVRRLEAENTRLNSIVLSYTENSTRDINDIKKLYEQELEDAKRLIDDLARDKAKGDIEINKLKSDADEAAQKLAKRDKEAKTLEAKLKTADSEKIEYKSRYESLLSEQAHQADELAKLRPHVADLEKQLQKLKKQLEEETLLRVDLENKNQTLKEEIAFKAQLFAKEKDQLRSSKHVEIEQVDVRLRDEYDSRLVAEMQRIRDETDREIAKMKDQVERSYLNRVSDAESSVRRVNTQITALKEERDNLKAKNDELGGEMKIFVTKITSLESKIKDLEEKLRKAQARYDKDISDKESEIAQLRKEIDDMLKEYQELYDIKINLDTEIACYRKLIESEEHRLNISSSAANSSAQLGASYIEPSSATRSGKKRRLANTQVEQDEVSSTQVQYSHSHQSRGHVDIGDHDLDGRQCRLSNTSAEKEQAVGGWVLKRTADGQVVEYKLGKNVVLKPGQAINVYSSNAGVTQDVAAGDFVLTGGQKWPVGDAMITVLVDKDGNEQARRESQRVVSSTVEKKLRSTPTRTPSSNAAQQPTSAVQKLFGLWKS